MRAPDPARRPAVARQSQYQREHRQRKARGEEMIRIRIGPRIVEALLARGLPDQDSRDRKKVAAELAEVLDQWANEWLK
jgi:hypothetical protein